MNSQLEICERQIEESLREIMESQELHDIEDMDVKELNPNNLDNPNVFLENAQNVKQHLEVSLWMVSS